HRYPIRLLPTSRLTPPRSGPERSDFVPWLFEVGIVPRLAGFRIVEREPHQRMAAGVAQEVRPKTGVGPLRAEDEYSSGRTCSVMDLLLEPFEFVPTPARLQVAARHDDHQHAASACLRFEIIGQECSWINLRVHPETQAIEFLIE